MNPPNKELEAMMDVMDADFDVLLQVFIDSNLLLSQEIAKVTEMVNVNTVGINKLLTNALPPGQKDRL